jgi:hypothetical protein
MARYANKSYPVDEEEAVELIVEENSEINMQPISLLSAVDYLE